MKANISPSCAALHAAAAAMVALLALTCGAAHGADAPASVPAAWAVPDIATLPDDEWGRAVRYGHALVTKTSTLIGPEVADPAHRYAGNNLNCQNCHLEAGTKEFGLPFQGVYADFPNYRARSGSVGTIEDRIQGCMTRSMNGRAFAVNGPELTALVSYLKFLSTGRAVGAATPGRGAGSMTELARAADPKRGATLYGGNCAACHGKDGQGQRVGKVGDTRGYVFPPLWGNDSFNNGAGMDRLIIAANFIHNNMPNGTNWQHPALSVDDSWDVAAFINAQPRPQKAKLEQDYPKRTEKPIDAPYGPYADNIDLRQHKLGPFAPIREAAKKLKADAKTDPHGTSGNTSE